MFVTKKCEVLKSLPAYGDMYIPISENNDKYCSEGFVVSFHTSKGSNWVGNFEPGWTNLNAVYEFNHQLYILVIAGGTCYLMNPDVHKPISILGVGYEVVLKSSDGRLILQDDIGLLVFEINGEQWSTDRISWDGIKDLKVEGNLVSGLSFDPMNQDKEWVEFVVDLENRNVKGGSYGQFGMRSVDQNVGEVNEEFEIKKPWWKIW